MNRTRHWLSLVIATTMFLMTGCGTLRGGASESSDATEPSSEQKSEARAEKSIGHEILWYLPNRVLDLFDIFRLRLRAGPGLSANVRITDYANAYIGRHYTGYLGLPGPRMGPEVRWPAGLEYEKGLVLMGVDATDDLPHPPLYAPTECNIGVQLLLVGAEAGFDPVELGDFFAGFLLIDVREDDR